MRIAFIGGGNMARAIVGGLISKGMQPAEFLVIDVDVIARSKLAAQFGVEVAESMEKVAHADVVVFAVKPQQMREAAAEAARHAGEALFITIAAGIRLADLSRWLGGYRDMVRVMPNTPALIGAGVAGLYAAAGVGAGAKKSAERILGAVGKTVGVKEEALLDPVTAVSASSPAYVFWFIEQLAAAGVALGLPEKESMQLAKEAVLGSAMLAARSKETPATLRERVTSKGGTTQAALDVFQKEQMAERFKKAVEAASRRGAEMGDAFGKD